MDSHSKSIIEEKINLLSRRLEMVLKTTSNPSQKKRVSIELAKLKKDQKRLQEGNFSDQDVRRYVSEKELTFQEPEEEAADRLADYTILSAIPIEPASPDCFEPEINAIHSFIAFFEHEYWGGISDFTVKLDYNYSQKREVFFNDLNVIQIAFKNYLDIISDLNSESVTRDYEEKLKTMRTKYYMDLIMKVGEFINRLHNFVASMLEDYRNGGNVILNPDETLRFDKIHGERALEGMTVVEGLESLNQFLEEFEDYLNIPEIKRIEQPNLFVSDEDEEDEYED